MKRIISLFLLVAFLLSLTACASTQGDTAPSTTGNTSPSTENETPPVVDDGTLPGTNIEPDEPVVDDGTLPGTNIEPDEPVADDPVIALTELLSDTNFNGSLTVTIDEPADPGSFAPVEIIPQPDQTAVGGQFLLTFASEESPETFVFHYLLQDEGERLVVIFVGDDLNLPLLVLLETHFGGIEGLVQALQTDSAFDAKILAMANLDSMEGQMYAYNHAIMTRNIPDSELVDIENPEAFVAQEYLGAYYVSNDTIFIKGTCDETISETLQGNISVFQNIYKRFSLTDLIYITE